MDAVDRHRKESETGFPQFAVISFSLAFFHSSCFIISLFLRHFVRSCAQPSVHTLTRIRSTFMLSANRISVLFIVLCRSLFLDDAMDFQCSDNVPLTETNDRFFLHMPQQQLQKFYVSIAIYLYRFYAMVALSSGNLNGKQKMIECDHLILCALFEVLLLKRMEQTPTEQPVCPSKKRRHMCIKYK